MAIAQYTEDLSSHIPALQVLIGMGFTYLPPSESVKKRSNKKSRVVLDVILKEWLEKNNSIEVRNVRHSFSEANITKAIDDISNRPFDSLLNDNEKIYDLLALGKSYEQTVEGDTKSYSLQYINWKDPKKNVFHITDEFEVEKRHSNQTRRPDIVLFVNGIPLVVIECKRPDKKGALKEGISQQIRNQMNDEIPHLFTFSQLLLSCCQNMSKYGTAGTPDEHWMIWREEDEAKQEEILRELINKELTPEVRDLIFKEKKDYQRAYMEKIWSSGDRLPSPQDKALHSLLSPERLLELVYRYIIFDNKIKKACRYQQYFAIKATVERIINIKGDEQRSGGVIWHTTGSGKSLTMVMMAKALTLESSIKNPRIILVTDRVDLDDQIWKTFIACGKEVKKAASGSDLVKLLEEKKADIITTVIDKFESASRSKNFKDESHNVFVLVDESHRSQNGLSHAKMINIFPKACYIGFTGTPLLKKEKSTAAKFGGFIHKYTMNQAVKDGAVVPLLYEGRMSELRGDRAQLDRWFERITIDLTGEQKADLKKKFKREEELLKADQRLMEIAYDIRDHYITNFKGTAFKGQLACSSKQDAIKFKKYFDEFKDIKSDVVISAPDTREEHTDIDESNVPEVQVFWKDMMNRYGNEKRYNESIIKAFKYSDEPELIIVVDKLLTGFDAPKNAVLYVDKRLKDHSILQAIARVNRVAEGKSNGLIIDYRGIFGEINDAIDTYAALENEGFEKEDVEGTLVNVETEINELAQRHTNVWEIFKEVLNKNDIESMQRHLEPVSIRQDFYKRLTSFSKTLQLALSNSKFQDKTDEKAKKNYQIDLKMFINLRSAIKQRYGETVDYSNYEKQLRNMVNKYIGADQVKIIIEQTSIFDETDFEKELQEITGDAAKADTIASRMKRTINHRMEEDPALYKMLSEMIDEAIKSHREKRLSDAEYLKKMKIHMAELRGKTGGEKYPEIIRANDDAKAYFGILKEYINLDAEIQADHSLKVDQSIKSHKVRDWIHNQDVQNEMINDIEDILFLLKGKYDLVLSHDVVDTIIERLIMTAKRRDS